MDSSAITVSVILERKQLQRFEAIRKRRIKKVGHVSRSMMFREAIALFLESEKEKEESNGS